ncbi:MAG: hypothetical protein ABI947_16010 [Chloroflexota bacterium]
MTHPSVVHTALSKLARSEIGSVNGHTLPIALDRAERDQVNFAAMSERQVALALLERIGFPESANELSLFLNVNHTLTPTDLSVDEITDLHAPPYITWLAGFLNDPEANIQKNARILLRWLVTNRQSAIQTKPESLDMLRRVVDDPVSSWKNAAFIGYALGMCGTIDDYERVIKQSEIVIEHDREHIELVAEALYKMYPPALINALQYFIEHTPPNSKQFIAGIQLLAKVADIDDQSFWNTYYDDMDHIVEKVTELAGQNYVVERILDLIEKHLALATDEE